MRSSWLRWLVLVMFGAVLWVTWLARPVTPYIPTGQTAAQAGLGLGVGTAVVGPASQPEGNP